MKEDLENAYYVYGFARPNQCAKLTGGIDEERPLQLCPNFGGVAAILSPVARADFCGPTGDAHLSDLAWIAPRAIRHQAVLEEVMKQGPVLPARFGTLFSTMGKLEAFVATHATAISAFLTNVEGHQEWSVQGFMDSSVSEPAWMAGKHAEMLSQKNITPGMAYMMEERLRINMKQELGDWIIEKSSELLDLLTPLETEANERRLLPKEIPDSKKEMVSNWAFLVSAANLPEFRANVEQVSGECKSMGLTFELTGPWPPYSFCPNLADTPDSDEISQES